MSHEVTRPEVQEQIRWIMAHPTYLNKVSRQSEPYIYHILNEIKKKKLPGELALLPMLESAYDPFAYSGAGAAGLWQLMPRTGTDLGLKQDWWFDGRRSIGSSTEAALNYLLYLNKYFDGQWMLAIAAYDSGEGTISRAIKSCAQAKRSVAFWNLPIPQETKMYVPRLFALAEIINNPGRYKVSLPNIPYLPYFKEVDIGSQIDLTHAAKLAGISYKELIKLNPGYNRWTTAPYKPFKLLIPAEKVDHFNLNLSNFPEDKRVSWARHQVHKGESLNNIASRYNTTVNMIKQLNQLTTNQVNDKQSILIPSKTAPATAQKQVAQQKVQQLPRVKLHPQPQAPAQLRSHRMIHIVQNNDSYSRLQMLYGATATEIQIWNKLPRNYNLRKGQQLVIWKKIQSKGTTYRLRAGDNLAAIASQYKTTVGKLYQLNPGLAQAKSLRLGQAIVVG